MTAYRACGTGRLVVLHSVFFVTVLALIFSHFPDSAIAQVSDAGKPAVTEKLFSRGKVLYQKQCSSCHGVDGAGAGQAAYLLYPKPRDFTRGQFRLISSSEMEATDEDLFRTITYGMPGSAMPSWRFLSAEERWALVYYVRYLQGLGKEMGGGTLSEKETEEGLAWSKSKELIEAHQDEKSMEVPEAPSVTPESLTRGKELFKMACVSCHGATGKGDGKMAMQDSRGYPLRPRDLTAGIFKGDSSVKGLYFRIVAGLPGTPMPSYRDALTQEQIWDIIYYVKTLSEGGRKPTPALERGQFQAGRTDEKLVLNPQSNVWSNVEPISIPLTPLWWRTDRVEDVEVRALHDGKSIAIHLKWSDDTEDDSTVTPQSFSDGVALQFSKEKDPPFFAMGSAESPVTIWNWKASWQKETMEWEDIDTEYPNAATDFYQAQKDYEHGKAFETRDAKTKFHDPLFATGRGVNNPLSDPERKSAAEEAGAEGFGTLTTLRPAIEKVQALGNYNDGVWQVVFLRELAPSEKQRLQLQAGESVSVAFAVWDGAKSDRNGQKMVSVWNELVLEA